VRKLSVPGKNPLDVFDVCVAGISDVAQRQEYVNNRTFLVDAIADFDRVSREEDWFNLPRSRYGNPDQIVLGTLTKQQLTDLYSTYMVESRGQPRKIYDEIFVAAGGSCPFCGGIGHAFTLDHYLPKAYYPAYSVNPSNLVPCCRDCNTGKQGSFAYTRGDQTIHPYFDAEIYFSSRWIYADITRENPITIRFECRPPDHWTEFSKLRAQKHFEDYNLAYRYGINAGAELSRIIGSRAGALYILSANDFRAHLIDYANASGFDLNGWSRTLYASLAASDWFCRADYRNPDWHL
jgi:5-methylcytosine-specific restriction endonuclease McrA